MVAHVLLAGVHQGLVVPGGELALGQGGGHKAAAALAGQYLGVQRGNVTTFTVYDPNFPGQTRALVLDHNKDTWTYRNAQSPAGRLVTLSGKGHRRMR